MFWININDRLPFAGQEILFCSNGEIFIPPTYGLYLGDKFKEKRFYSRDGKSYEATHWMTLPDIPKDIKERKYDYIDILESINYRPEY